MLLGKDSNALRKILPEWLYRFVYRLHYTPNPVFFHQVAHWTTWPQRRKKNAVMFASSTDSGACILLSNRKILPALLHFLSLLLLTPYIYKVHSSLWYCCPFGEQILLQVVFLTPCVHDHVTTPTRGWWKITSLQATGKWMVLAVYHIIQPNSEPAWHRHGHFSLYFAFKSSKAFTESIKWIQLLNCISFTPRIIRTCSNAM